MPRYTSPADLEIARGLLRDYELFNLRGLDREGHFDCFDHVPGESFSSWVDVVAASPHGWTDVVFISRPVMNSAPMAAFREAYDNYAKTRNPERCP